MDNYGHKGIEGGYSTRAMSDPFKGPKKRKVDAYREKLLNSGYKCETGRFFDHYVKRPF